MANIVSDEAKKSMIAGATGEIDFMVDTIKAMLCSATFVQARGVQFIDEGGASDAVDARIAGTTDQTLGTKSIGKDTTTGFGYILAANPTWSAVASGTVAKVVIYKDTGTPTTSKILCTLDVTVTANGGDITVSFATAANGGIMKNS